MNKQCPVTATRHTPVGPGHPIANNGLCPLWILRSRRRMTPSRWLAAS